MGGRAGGRAVVSSVMNLRVLASRSYIGSYRLWTRPFKEKASVVFPSCNLSHIPFKRKAVISKRPVNSKHLFTLHY
jgi:hypothetical protein